MLFISYLRAGFGRGQSFVCGFVITIIREIFYEKIAFNRRR